MLTYIIILIIVSLFVTVMNIIFLKLELFHRIDYLDRKIDVLNSIIQKIPKG